MYEFEQTKLGYQPKLKKALCNLILIIYPFLSFTYYCHYAYHSLPAYNIFHLTFIINFIIKFIIHIIFIIRQQILLIINIYTFYFRLPLIIFIIIVYFTPFFSEMNLYYIHRLNRMILNLYIITLRKQNLTLNSSNISLLKLLA